jgi:hypothetical protein|tara:strand:- start:1715 stop:2152 length:438 start_codon:yes stop_codon:yes gene_type:complete
MLAPLYNVSTKNYAMIDESRIKLLLTRDGDTVICDLQEAVDKDSGDRQAYLMTVPYKVEISEQPSQVTDPETFEDQEIKIRYTPWNPFTIDTRIAIQPDYVVSIMEPAPSLLHTYLSNVRKKQGDQGAPVATTIPEIIAPDGTVV